jgi:esterase
VPAGAHPGRFRTSDDLELRWLEWGNPAAPPVVMLHGLRSYAATFSDLAHRLADRRRCLALDARGRGGSDWDPRGDYHTDTYVRDLDEFVDGLGLHRFDLVGHSKGAATAVVYAASRPDRVRALVLEDMLPGSALSGAGAERIRREVAATPRGFADAADAFAYWRRLRPLAPDAAIWSRVRHTTRPTGAGTGALAWIPDMDGIGAARLDVNRPPLDLWPAFTQVSRRTLVVCGADSDFTDEATLATVSCRNPAVTATRIDGAGHYVHDDQPDQYAERVRAFLLEAHHDS